MVEAVCKNNTCYLCTEKHREIGRGHREFNLNLNVATLIAVRGLGDKLPDIQCYNTETRILKTLKSKFKPDQSLAFQL